MGITKKNVGMTKRRKGGQLLIPDKSSLPPFSERS